MLRRQFDLDDESLEELIEELVDIQRVARREENALAWSAATPVVGSPSPARDPRAYTPKHLADKILQSKSVLEGERKQVTVLFADVKGSMELAEQLDPEEWSQIMNRFFQILADGVERFEGFVDKFTGDGIMALFGAPIAHEDHAQRACYAALHLRDRLRQYADELRIAPGVNFSFRLGLNSGEVIVGKIGDDLRMDYTAQGHTVGLAQRMEQLAPPDSIALSQHTQKPVDGYFALRPLGPVQIKGAREPVGVFVLEGVGVSRTRFDISRARGLSRFVGRGDEMQVLESALARAREGNAQIVGIVGEAGLGKSRLCFEFLERCRARGLMTYETTGVAHGKAIPFLPMLRLFRAFFRITEQDSESTARERIAGRMLLLDEGLRESLPLVFDFMGVADPENPAPRIDPEARQRQMFDIVRRVNQARGQRETQVTLLEDLHWFDSGSEAYLEPLIDARAGTRSLMLLNFRPEYQVPWMGKSFYHQLPLAPLSPEAIRELIDALLGNHPSTAGLAEAIYARTGGNPFFTEEVVQNLIESGKLQGSKGAYRLVTPVAKLEVPSSVHALLAARIDRLAQRDKDVLQTAAVIGREFDEPTLAAVVEQAAPQLREALQKLKDAEFVYEQSLYPVAEYLFKHPLTQEVALASQLQERRKRLHAAVARVIEAAHAKDLDQQAALLAHHWEESADLGQAVRWHRRAAEWAGRTDFAAATRHWGRVRALLRELPGDREAAPLGIAACTQLLNVSWRVGTLLDEARALLEEGQTLANAIGDRRAHLYLSMVYGRARSAVGDVAESLELAIENQRVALEIDDIAAQANACFYLADALVYSGRLPEAIRIAEDGLARFPRHMPREEWLVGVSPYSGLSVWRGICLTWMGRIPEGLEELGRCRRLAEEDGTPELAGYALFYAAEAYYHAHDADRALASARQVEEISRRLGEPPIMLPRTPLAFAYAHLAAGRAADAIEPARAALDLHGRVDRANAGKAASLLAEALLQAGDLSAAQSAASEAIALCRRSLRGNYEAEAHGVVARALLRRDGAAARDAAQAALDSAAALIERTGAKTLAPALCEWRAELAAVLGDDVTRAQLLRQAQQGYDEIGAPAHAARAKALLDELGR